MKLLRLGLNGAPFMQKWMHDVKIEGEHKL